MPTTIRDVAKRAGVAPSTVSKALNQSGAVAPETEKKIRQAASALGYQPNVRARSFAMRASRQIAFVADFPFDAAFVNPHLFEIMRGVQHTLGKKGYSMVMKQADRKLALEYVQQGFAQRAVDGFVLHMSAVTKKLGALISGLDIPHIIIGKPDFDNRLCWIDTDNCLSGELAAKHLIDLGYTHMAFVGGRADDMTCWRRLIGVKKALEAHKLSLPPERVLQSHSTLADGSLIAKKLLRMQPRPQAVISANNPIALGLMQALGAKGIRVPEDMALISFDTHPFSLLTEPPMTVVDVNMYEMGQEAGRLVLQKLHHPAMQIQTYITSPVLIGRGTTERR